MPRKSRIQLVEERLTAIEQTLTNEIRHRLARQEKLMWWVLGILGTIFAAGVANTLK